MNQHHHHHGSSRALDIDTRLVTAGAMLTMCGSLVAFAGVALVGVAVVNAGRRWVRRMEVPPGELAAAKLRQAKQASLAGMQAWQAASGDGGRSAQ
ncbi:hypothetical protein [Streptantibioticus ferralitis]|uniref:Uncharacterized protein n=1 Tax=Streptantibioticus ferralitis TaxID=236510 RepID=A0ABT5YTP1_9ACTN|nr:hypothetical protein [Streptantibioticus ferralitis]MDF2254924.1 hypothetical protein [Streptantibioticus ferralitis]